MRALVTGGAGFIGSNLVDALIERGDAVLVYDDLATGREENVNPEATFVHASILDTESVADACRRHAPDTVFHLAAKIDVRESVSDPFLDARVNIGGTITVLEAARAHGVKRVVFSSTGGAIYGEADVIPTPETAPPRTISPYAQSKSAADGYVGLYRRLHGLSTIALRYANVYGPRQDPLGEGGVVAIFCDRSLRGEQATVFGDGEQTRDFVYVGDVVAANLIAAESDAGGAYNVGCGIETTVNALAEELGLDTLSQPERPGEVRRSCLDATRAGEMLGWRAQTDVAEGMRRTLDALR